MLQDLWEKTLLYFSVLLLFSEFWHIFLYATYKSQSDLRIHRYCTSDLLFLCVALRCQLVAICLITDMFTSVHFFNLTEWRWVDQASLKWYGVHEAWDAFYSPVLKALSLIMHRWIIQHEIRGLSSNCWWWDISRRFWFLSSHLPPLPALHHSSGHVHVL